LALFISSVSGALLVGVGYNTSEMENRDLVFWPLILTLPEPAATTVNKLRLSWVRTECLIDVFIGHVPLSDFNYFGLKKQREAQAKEATGS
jgi:hypothetical protein